MENVGGYINTFSIPMGESKMDTDYIEETIRKELLDNGINKKGLAKLYKEHGVLDTLFPKTFSCEGTVEDTKNHTQQILESYKS